MKVSIDIPEIPCSVDGETDDPENECAIVPVKGGVEVYSNDWLTFYKYKRIKRSNRVVLVEHSTERCYR